MSTAPNFQVKKAFLYCLIVSVLLSAVLGILAILSGTWGWFEVRVLLTTITISGASICGLANGAYLATKRGQILPWVGIALTLVGAAMLIIGMWMEIMPAGRWQVVYWQLAVSVSVFAVAGASAKRSDPWACWGTVAAACLAEPDETTEARWPPSTGRLGKRKSRLFNNEGGVPASRCRG